MSKKIPLGISLAVTFIAVAISVALTITYTMKVYNNLVQDLPQRVEMYDKLSDVDNLVRTNYYGDIDSDKVDAQIAKGYISGLDDRYSKYFSAEEYAVYEDLVSGNIAGIGIDVSFNDGVLSVTNVANESPAEQGGICKGDIIVAIENKEVTEKNYSELTAYLDGEKLTSVDLLLKRGADEDTFEVNIAKGYKARSCFYSISGTIGYIKLSDFYENTAETFSKAIEAFNSEGVTGIVIDVRNNSSNNLSYAAQVIDLIVPIANEGTGEIATVVNSKDETVEFYASDSESINLPIAVLINDRTAGVAELLACDLRDFGKAKLYGEATAGHGTLQKIFKLSDGGALLLTVGKICPYISDCYDDLGVKPDVTVITDSEEKDNLDSLSLEEDSVYLASLEQFS